MKFTSISCPHLRKTASFQSSRCTTKLLSSEVYGFSKYY